MSGLACAIHCLDRNWRPVLQLQTRHRSRYDFEAEVVGAAAVGVRNIICLTDDTGRLAPAQPPSPNSMIWMRCRPSGLLRRLRDEGVNRGQANRLNTGPTISSAQWSPYAALPAFEAVITEKKINGRRSIFCKRCLFLIWPASMNG